MLLEGDNYIWLKILEQTHVGKIDVIYIDPPYNTGNKDFKYNDSFVGEDDVFRHSKWLDFMDKRLRVARELLSEDGIIFISIADDEFAQLKLLCDEIFGFQNAIRTICVELSKVQGMKVKSAQDGNIVKNHEYILVYAKDIDLAISNRQPLYDGGDAWDYHYTHVIEKSDNGEYIKTGIMEHMSQYNPELLFTLQSEGFNKLSDLNGVLSDNNLLKNRFYDYYADSLMCGTAPANITVPQDVKKRLENGYIVPYKKYLLYMNSNGTMRQYLSLRQKLHMTDDYDPSYCCATIRGALWKGFNLDMVGVRHEGAVDFKNGKKPVRLVKQLLKWANRPQGKVLDFFAGSGTTAHAVEELNAEDDGRRQWILITNNEDQDTDDNNSDTGICRDITKPRIDTIITGIRPDGSRYSEGADSGYQYFQYEFVPRSRYHYERNAISFFRPDIVDALIPVAYGVHKTVEDTEKMLCVYEGNETKIACCFGNVNADTAKEIATEYLNDENFSQKIVMLPRDCPSYKEITSAMRKNGIETAYHSSLIKTSGYLE